MVNVRRILFFLLLQSMDRLKTSLSYLFIFLLVGFICGVVIKYFVPGLDVNPALHSGLFTINLIGFLIILGFYNFSKYKGIGFVFLGLIIFKFFAVAYLFYRFRTDFSDHILVYFILYWIYMMTDMLLVIKLIKKQD